MAFFGQGSVAGISLPTIVFVVVVVVAYFVLYHTAFGRSIYAVGGNPVAAWLSGINVRNTQFAAFAISGFLAGLAGVLTLGRVLACTMHTLLGLEILTIAAVCIGGISLMGGRGSLIGTLIGVLILAFINNGMSVLGASPAVQGIVRGIIIIIAVTVDYMRRRRG
ncbi:Ribose import permease protein RbsC [subsurface metagenome]